jgi:hypothetical protein
LLIELKKDCISCILGKVFAILCLPEIPLMNQNLKPTFLKGRFFLLLSLIILVFLQAGNTIQPLALRVKQNGNQLLLSFPRLENRSAVKVIDLQGSLVKGALIDENQTRHLLTLESYKKGIHEVIIINRVQRFSAKVLLQ